MLLIKKIIWMTAIVLALTSIFIFYKYSTVKKPVVVSSVAVPRTADLSSSFRSDLIDLEKYWSYIHKAQAYLDAGNYDASLVEYQNAERASRSQGDVWMTRDLKRKLYTKSGQYFLALQEIEWLANNNKRPDVLRDLAIEKSRLLAAKAQSNQT